MTTPKALLPALACLVLALTCAPVSAGAEPSPAGDRARAVKTRLAVKVPTAPVQAATGSWVTLKVVIRNTARTTARKVAVRATASQGMSLEAARVRLGSIAPLGKETARLRVRIDTAAAAVVSISASSRKTTTRSKKVALTPTSPPPPPPPGVESAWRGNFTGPTTEGIGFTLSGDRTTITAWTGPRVYGSCADQGSTFAWYPDTSLDTIPVDAAGNFVGTSSYVDSGGFDHSVRVSGTLSGTSVVNGALTHTATWARDGSTAVCSISDAQQTWSATRG